jgi:hypothetical protein
MGEIELADVRRGGRDPRRRRAHAVLRSRTLSEIAGCELFLKFENLQYTAASGAGR